MHAPRPSRLKRSEGEEAEQASRVDEADALPQRLRIARERLHQPAEALRGVDRIEQEPFLPRELYDDPQLRIGRLRGAGPLVAVQQVDGLGHLDGEAEALDGGADRPDDGLAHPLGRAGDRHAHDLAREARRAACP